MHIVEVMPVMVMNAGERSVYFVGVCVLREW